MKLVTLTIFTFFAISLVVGRDLPGENHVKEKASGPIRRKPGLIQRALLEDAALRLPEPFGEALLTQKLKTVEDYALLDEILIDMRTVLVQSAKVAEGTSFPHTNYAYDFELCIWMVCSHFWVHSGSSESHLSGQHDITSETKITDNFIRNTFHIPKVKLSSPNYIYNVTAQNSLLWQDVEFLIENMTTSFSANYSHDPSLGIQISNLNIDYSVDIHQSVIKNYTWILGNGTIPEKNETRLFDHKNKTLTEWEIKREEYQTHLQLRINCVLSGGRIDPEICVEQESDEYDSARYNDMNILQIFETLGLRGMNRQPNDGPQYSDLFVFLYTDAQWLVA